MSVNMFLIREMLVIYTCILTDVDLVIASTDVDLVLVAICIGQMSEWFIQLLKATYLISTDKLQLFCVCVCVCMCVFVCVCVCVPVYM